MSSQPFGAAPPPETPAPEPQAPAKRSPLLLFGAPALAALLVAGGLSYVLLGGSADDDLATGIPPAAPAPSGPTPSPDPSTEVPRTLPLSASRNPFDPLVQAPAGSSVGVGPAPGTAPGTASTASTGGVASSTSPSVDPFVVIPLGGGSSTPGSGSGSGPRPGPGLGPDPGPGPGPGPGSGSGSNAGPPPSGSGPGSGPGPGPGGSPGPPPTSAPPAASSLDAVATCKAGDALWATYREAMKDASTTHTMAGHRIGPVTDSLDSLATTTSVEELRQPLRTWARASASVRTQLVSGTAVRDVEPTNPLDDSTGGTPRPGVRPVVDQSSILLARTAVRERCYQLTDPLVKKDSL